MIAIYTGLLVLLHYYMLVAAMAFGMAEDNKLYCIALAIVPLPTIGQIYGWWHISDTYTYILLGVFGVLSLVTCISEWPEGLLVPLQCLLLPLPLYGRILGWW